MLNIAKQWERWCRRFVYDINNLLDTGNRTMRLR
jgi:hypothetical protein